MREIIVSISILLSVCTCANGAPGTETESGKLLSDWITVQLRLVRTTQGVPHVAYTRHFAYTSLALYESVVPGDKNHHSMAGQLNGLETLPSYKSAKSFIMHASANAAYAAMLKFFYGNNSNARLIDSLENVNQEWLLTQGYTREQITFSSDFGRSIAKAIQSWAASDNADKANAPYTPSGKDDSWKPTPPKFLSAAMPYWKNNRRMVKESDPLFTSLPPTYSNDAQSGFYKMVKEVYDVSQQLTSEQKKIAWFWDDSPNGKFLSVSGHWSSILRQVIVANKLSLLVSAEAFAKLHLAIYDASITSWSGKYQYNVVRPITYIQKNISSTWLPLIETPPHPEFPAAHATLSSAAATALTQVLGEIKFTDRTYSDLGMEPRMFSSFEDAAREAGISRLYGGIHYRFSIDQGLVVGKKTAQAIVERLKFK